MIEERIDSEQLNEVAIEHLHRYKSIFNLVKDKKVLDAACGSGYGSYLLSQVAAEVHGVDISSISIEYAKSKYSKSNLHYYVSNVSQLEFEDESFDIIISFETIEHLYNQTDFLREMRRVLKKNGVLVISTPNKLNYTDKSQNINPFHVKELYKNEFSELLSKEFRYYNFYYQKFIFASLIYSDINSNKVKVYEGDFHEIIDVNFEENSFYFIVIASNDEKSDKMMLDSLFLLNSDIIYGRAHKMYQGSYSYRVGNFIISPVTFIKNMMKKLTGFKI